MEIADTIFFVLSRTEPYFVKEHSDSKSKYTEDDIINMLEFIVENIFVVFGGKFFFFRTDSRHSKSAPMVADIFFYSYGAIFGQSLQSVKKKTASIQPKWSGKLQNQTPLAQLNEKWFKSIQKSIICYLYAKTLYLYYCQLQGVVLCKHIFCREGVGGLGTWMWMYFQFLSFHFVINSNRDFYYDVFTILNPNLINDMNQMRISGTDPSSVILSQRK